MRYTVVRLNVCLVTLVCLAVATMTLQAQPQGPEGRSPIDRMDRNNDGKLSKNEFRGPNRVFIDMDSDNDGYVTSQEMQEFHRKRGGRKQRTVTKKYQGPYPDLIVKKYDKDKTWQGNVLFVDKNRNRIVEAGLDGKIVWECSGPESEVSRSMRRSCGARLTDVELLPNNNVLILSGGIGVYELDRKCNVLWSYENETVSHDADRLKNCNTIMACVGAEKVSGFPYKDPQAIEVDPEGKIVWAWYAKKEYADSKYKDIRSKDADDWTHMNSVQRLKDGNTLLSVRNWNLLIAVDKKGMTTWKTGVKEIPKNGWGRQSPHCPHTPVLLDNGNIILSEPIKGRVIEWNPKQEIIVWKYPDPNWRQGGPYYFIRAAHRLPNGNTFIIDSLGQFVEVTSNGEVVWHARLVDYMNLSKPPRKEELFKVPCFNADRRGMPYYGGR